MAPADYDIDDRVEVIEEFIERKNDDRLGEVEGQTGGGGTVRGYEVAHGDHRYMAMATTDLEHLLVRFTVDVDAYYHVYENTDSSPSEESVQVTQQEMQEARKELEQELQDQPTVAKRELRLNLKQVLCREGCAVDFDTYADALNIHGFNVDKPVHPRPDGFWIGDFQQAVQNVINFGWTGKDLILEYYGLHQDTEPGSPGY